MRASSLGGRPLPPSPAAPAAKSSLPSHRQGNAEKGIAGLQQGCLFATLCCIRYPLPAVKFQRSATLLPAPSFQPVFPHAGFHLSKTTLSRTPVNTRFCTLSPHRLRISLRRKSYSLWAGGKNPPGTSATDAGFRVPVTQPDGFWKLCTLLQLSLHAVLLHLSTLPRPTMVTTRDIYLFTLFLEAVFPSQATVLQASLEARSATLCSLGKASCWSTSKLPSAGCPSMSCTPLLRKDHRRTRKFTGATARTKPPVQPRIRMLLPADPEEETWRSPTPPSGHW